MEDPFLLPFSEQIKKELEENYVSKSFRWKRFFFFFFSLFAIGSLFLFILLLDKEEQIGWEKIKREEEQVWMKKITSPKTLSSQSLFVATAKEFFQNRTKKIRAICPTSFSTHKKQPLAKLLLWKKRIQYLFFSKRQHPKKRREPFFFCEQINQKLPQHPFVKKIKQQIDKLIKQAELHLQLHSSCSQIIQKIGKKDNLRTFLTWNNESKCLQSCGNHSSQPCLDCKNKWLYHHPHSKENWDEWLHLYLQWTQKGCLSKKTLDFSFSLHLAEFFKKIHHVQELSGLLVQNKICFRDCKKYRKRWLVPLRFQSNVKTRMKVVLWETRHTPSYPQHLVSFFKNHSSFFQRKKTFFFPRIPKSFSQKEHFSLFFLHFFQEKKRVDILPVQLYDLRTPQTIQIQKRRDSFKSMGFRSFLDFRFSEEGENLISIQEKSPVSRDFPCMTSLRVKRRDLCFEKGLEPDFLVILQRKIVTFSFPIYLQDYFKGLFEHYLLLLSPTQPFQKKRNLLNPPEWNLWKISLEQSIDPENLFSTPELLLPQNTSHGYEQMLFMDSTTKDKIWIRTDCHQNGRKKIILFRQNKILHLEKYFSKNILSAKSDGKILLVLQEKRKQKEIVVFSLATLKSIRRFRVHQAFTEFEFMEKKIFLLGAEGLPLLSYDKKGKKRVHIQARQGESFLNLQRNKKNGKWFYLMSKRPINGDFSSNQMVVFWMQKN